MKRFPLELGVIALMAACGTDTAEESPPDIEVAFLSDEGTTSSEDCSEIEATLLDIRDGIEAAEYADEAAEDIQFAIYRIRALAVRSADESLSEVDRARLHQRFVTWSEQQDRVANTASFQDTHLSNADSSWDVDVGEASVEVPLADLRATTLGVDSGSIGVDTSHNALAALDDLETANETVAAYRGELDDALYSLYAYSEATHADLRACDLPAARQINTRCDHSRDPSAVEATGEAMVLRALSDDLRDSLAMIQRADGVTEHASEIIARMAETATAAMAETDDEARRSQQAEFLGLDAALTRGAQLNEYRRIYLSEGSNSTLALQLGDSAGEQLFAKVGDLRATVLAVDSGSIYMEEQDAAEDAQANIRFASEHVETLRAGHAADQDTLSLYADRVNSDRQDCED